MASSTTPCSLPIAIALLLLCFLFASSWATSRPSQDGPATLTMAGRFHRWMERHGKSYATADEELRRFEVYRRNVEHIEATNRGGGLSYMLGENQFTDLTSEEFLATYTGRYAAPEMGGEDEGEMVITTHAGDVTEGHAVAVHGGNLSAVPESIDWRAKGAVTPVKNQGQCDKAKNVLISFGLCCC